MVERLEALPPAEQHQLCRAVEAAERDRELLHRASAEAAPVPHPISLSPVVLPARLLPTLHRLARAIHRFQAQAPDLYRDGVQDFRELCPLEPHAEAWFFRCYRGGDPWDLLVRLDVGLGPDDGLCLYETNSTALAGLFNHSAGVEILDSIVLPRVLSPTEQQRLIMPPDLLGLLFDWVTRACRRLRIRARGPLGIAFVEPAGGGPGLSEIPQIARFFAARGVIAPCGAPVELRLTDGAVHLRDQRVDLMYRDVAFSNLAEPPGSGLALAGFTTLLERRAALPGFSAEFDHKGILEACSSRAWRQLFSAAEARLLRQCVPWTRVLRARNTDSPAGEEIDLLRYTSAGKDALVIKPNRGSGGERVLLGRETTASGWDRAIDQALHEPGQWVVQARFDAMPRAMTLLHDGRVHRAPCFFSLGLFYARDQLGLHGRVSPHAIVNVARGGALACVFLADEGSTA